jgi:SAM-dependent methyltransferase
MKELKNHYKKLFSEYGDSANSVQYSDTKTQFKRFKVLTELDVQLNSVIDLGCGLGHLYDYLEVKEPGIKYLGLDFVEEFIEVAKNKSTKENVTFKLCDITNDTIPKGYDYVFLSGVFNNIMENNWEFMKLTLRKMFNACNKGIAFNAMSTYVDYFDEELFYVDPCKVFDFCKKELSSKVTLRNDYLIKENSIPFEFAIYVYK